MKLIPLVKRSLLALALFPVASYAEIPPMLKDAEAQRFAKDQMDRAYITPKRIVSMDAGKENTLIKDAHFLLKQGNGQAEMNRRNCCLMTSTDKEQASIVLDFGTELHGGLKLVMGSSTRREPSLVRIRFGESVAEASSTTYNSDWKVGFSTDDHAKRDITVEIPRDGMIEIGNTGFRFVRIDLLRTDVTISLKEVSAILRYRDIPYLGSFECSDSRLNQIWMTGAYTVHLNMQEYLWDGIKRDRAVWLGDMHPELMAISRVFGANEVIPRSMDLACQQFPLPGWMNGMSAYSMWYLINQYEWFKQTGDRDFLNRHASYISGLIHLVDTKVDEAGNETLSPSRFLDWPSSENKAGVEAGYRALIVWAMQDAQQLSLKLGRNDDANLCQDIIKRMKRKTLPHNNLKQAASLMAIAGLMDAQQACKDVVTVGGGKGFSTFYGYYMLEALAKAGQYDQALDIISTFWGGMLDLGATTFWEDFNLDWTPNAARIDEPVPAGMKDIHGDFGAYCYPGFRHSLCHGWSSGPTTWLTDHVLGVKMVDVERKQISVEPHLGKLQWAKGSYPTPWGVVTVSHAKRADGTVESKVTLPEGVQQVAPLGKDFVNGCNYDESKVPAYTLPDVLTCNDGTKVKNKKQWEQKRRPEVLELFTTQMFGRAPQLEEKLPYQVGKVEKQALNGRATRKEIRVELSNQSNGPHLDLQLYLPNDVKGKVPVFLGLSFLPNESITGKMKDSWQLEEILSHGYGLATFCYNDVDPDYDDGFQNGVQPAYYKEGQHFPAADEWGSIAAWAWGASRALDYLEQDTQVDAGKVAIIGHSRLGKAAVWAGATDPRFAIVYSGNSGCCGVALSRRHYGETVEAMNVRFPHWFCTNYKQYNEREAEMPFDQHELVALIAPRPVYIASAQDDNWSDQRGEFLGGKGAEPVYALYGMKGIGTNEMPPVDTPYMEGSIAYHNRKGPHAILPYDWQQFLRFADKYFKK